MPESLFPPQRHPLTLEEMTQFLPKPLLRIESRADLAAVFHTQQMFADEARQAYNRGDKEGAKALMRFVDEIRPDNLIYHSPRPIIATEEIPGFVAAHYTGGKGEVHNPADPYTPSALNQVRPGAALAKRLSIE